MSHSSFHRLFVAVITSSLFVASVSAASDDAPLLPAQPLRANESVGVVSAIEREDYAWLRDTGRIDIPGFRLDADRIVELSLERFDVFADDAQLIVVDEDGEHETERPPLALLRGDVTGEPGSRVFLAVSPDMVSGLIDVAGETFIVSSGPDGAGLQTRVYSLTNLPDDAIEWELFNCAALEVPSSDPPPSDVTSGARASVCRVVKIAIETDWQFRRIFGNTESAQAYATTIFAAISEIYDRDVSTTFSIIYLRIWNTNADPWDQNNAGDQLDQYRVYWTENMGHISKHLGHFLSGRNLGGGVAWLGTLCNNAYEYGLSGNLGGYFPYPIEHNSPQNWDLMVVAHEIGHNFGSPHTHEMNPPIDGCGSDDCSAGDTGTIMSYCHICPGGMSNIRVEFHPRSISESMEPFLTYPATLGRCLDLITPGPFITQHPVSQSVCAGSTVSFSVAADGHELSYQWRKNLTPIPGATSPTYVDSDARMNDVGIYDCLVIASCGASNSNAVYLHVCVVESPADLNQSCAVDLEDLAILLANFGATEATHAMGDINGDSAVDLSDLAIMLADYGQTGCL